MRSSGCCSTWSTKDPLPRPTSWPRSPCQAGFTIVSTSVGRGTYDGATGCGRLAICPAAPGPGWSSTRGSMPPARSTCARPSPAAASPIPTWPTTWSFRSESTGRRSRMRAPTRRSAPTASSCSMAAARSTPMATRSPSSGRSPCGRSTAPPRIAGAAAAAASFVPDREGNYIAQLRLRDSFGVFSVPDTATIAAAVTNRSPSFVSAPVTVAVVGQAYRYAVAVSDPDAGDALALSLATAPRRHGHRCRQRESSRGPLATARAGRSRSPSACRTRRACS